MGNKESSGSGGGSEYTGGSGSHHGGAFAFADVYSDLGSLQADLRRAGLESSNLIVGLDFTKSNEWTGKASFGGRCLHEVGPQPNPYESAVMIVGETLSAFDDDGLIPAYGFGSSGTNDRAVFSLLPRNTPCRGLSGVLEAYRHVVPNVKLAGPTSFGPIVRQATSIVKASGGQYHILLIICDGQVTRSSDLPDDELSGQEQDTVAAIVEASNYPLSIICVGVGDGEDGWRKMKELDDLIPHRRFDNFQFVPFNETLEMARRSVRSAASPGALKLAMEATFALHALMEIPQQYRAINALRLLGPTAVLDRIPTRVDVYDPPPPMVAPALPRAGSIRGDFGLGHLTAPSSGQLEGVGSMPAAPLRVESHGSAWSCPTCTFQVPQGNAACLMCGTAKPAASTGSSFAPSKMPSSVTVVSQGGAAESHARAPYAAPAVAVAAPAPPPSDARVCAVCMDQPLNVAFQCGHQCCETCAPRLRDCHICRQPITARIKLYA